MSIDSKVSVEDLPKAALIKPEALSRAQVSIADLPAVISDSLVTEKTAAQPQQQAEKAPGVSRGGQIQPQALKSKAEERDVFEDERMLQKRARRITNKGKDPKSRAYIRGILHPQPVQFWWSAVFTLLARAIILPLLVLIVLVVLEKVPTVWAFGLLAIPLVGGISLILNHQSRCRVCSQKEFLPNRALKHNKAHRGFLSNVILSTALHLILYKWIYCMFCGTAVRIKK